MPALRARPTLSRSRAIGNISRKISPLLQEPDPKRGHSVKSPDTLKAEERGNTSRDPVRVVRDRHRENNQSRPLCGEQSRLILTARDHCQVRPDSRMAEGIARKRTAEWEKGEARTLVTRPGEATICASRFRATPCGSWIPLRSDSVFDRVSRAATPARDHWIRIVTGIPGHAKHRAQQKPGVTASQECQQHPPRRDHFVPPSARNGRRQPYRPK